MTIKSHGYCAGHGDYRDHDVITWANPEEERVFKFALENGVIEKLILYWIEESKHSRPVKKR